MNSGQVSFELLYTSNMEEQIQAEKQAIDALTAYWHQQDMEIIAGVRQGYHIITQVMQGFRIALSAFHMTLGPLESALINTVMAGVNVAISTATMLISGIITAPAGLILMAAAFGVQLGSTAALMKSMGETRAMMAFLEQRIANLPTGIVSGLGGF